MLNKYGAKKQQIDGMIFDSQREAQRYQELLLAVRAGIISELQRQVKYELQPPFMDRNGRKVLAINYKPDFVYVENGRLIAEDVKGMETKDFKIKAKMFLYRYPDIELRIVK